VNYLQFSICIPSSDQREILIAQLTELGFEGFEETETGIEAFVSAFTYDELIVLPFLKANALDYKTKLIEPVNWNEQWESNFEAVSVHDLCTIRAHFHPKNLQTKYDIIITPKMSFGTGHHATTRLMIEQMEQVPFQNKNVLDFGTGTGVLAIFAEKLGANKIDAIDNDEWSYTNAQENIILNHAEKINVSTKPIDQFNKPFDVILANINRNILLDYMPKMSELLIQSGTLLMSGLLKEDEIIITEMASKNGFKTLQVNTLNNWISIKCIKQ
jgi:ribosomal protein L11 methyltransferase